MGVAGLDSGPGYDHFWDMSTMKTAYSHPCLHSKRQNPESHQPSPAAFGPEAGYTTPQINDQLIGQTIHT